MSRRAICFLICAILGVGMLIFGLLVPAHLRAVDGSVLRSAGSHTSALTEQVMALVRQNEVGAAQLLLQAGQAEGLPDQQAAGLAITNAAQGHPGWLVWGGGDARLDRLFTSDPHLPKAGLEPFTDFVAREDNRAVILELLRASQMPAVQELLQCRTLTNTVIFSPSQSAAGQAIDTALAICGLLLERGHLSGGLSNALFTLAQASNLGGEPQRLEQVLLDMMSLGQRFNWGQLVGFVGQIQDAETLRLLTSLVRRSDGQLPVLFAAVQLTGQPDQVAAYLMRFSQTGLKDLGASLRFGAGGVSELLRRNQRLHSSGFRERMAGAAPFRAVAAFASDLSWRSPRLSFMMKWLLYLAAGFLLAAALHFARPTASALERPLQVRGFHVAREMLFALGFLVTFVNGGLTGLYLGNVIVDVPLSATLFVVAHFHMVMGIAPIMVIFGAIYHWYPKMTGRMMDERLGKIHFWITFLGAYAVFFPMHYLGVMGVPRRFYELGEISWLPHSAATLNICITVAALVVGAAQAIFFFNAFWSLRHGKPSGPNPWRSTTLEWQTPETPPGHGNFGPKLPVVYRWAYAYSVPGAPEDFLPQNAPPLKGEHAT